jgi:hypothetical protein
MVKIRALVPLTHPKTAEVFAAGAEVDVADDVAADWKADGKISFIDDEKKAEEAAKEGNYSARMTRDKAGGTEATEEPPKRGKT